MMITMLLLLLFCVIQVMRTCKEVGIKTVAIYSDADAQAVSTEFACMHPFAMETAVILVHSLMLNRLSLCTKMAAVAVAKLLLCCDIMQMHYSPTLSTVLP